MKLNKNILIFAAAISISACGGGDSSPSATAAVLPVVVEAPSAYDLATNKAREDFEANLNALQAAADSWMAENGRAAGVVTSASGLQYKVNSSSSQSGGPSYTDGQSVKVHYEGSLTDGTIFDSSFKRGRPENLMPAELIEGWQEALALMSPGDEWTLYIPPSLGYGKRGSGSNIPANAVLIFDIELR